MIGLLTFDLMHDQAVVVDVNPLLIETLVDGTVFAKGVPCTQITMTSGNKFFVKQPLEDVRNAIRSL